MNSDQITRLKHELRNEGYNIYVYSYPGGMYFPPHSHDHETMHIVLSGSLRITMDGIDHDLTPGERFVIAANIVHSAEVLGEMPVVCLDATKPHG